MRRHRGLENPVAIYGMNFRGHNRSFKKYTIRPFNRHKSAFLWGKPRAIACSNGKQAEKVRLIPSRFEAFAMDADLDAPILFQQV